MIKKRKTIAGHSFTILCYAGIILLCLLTIYPIYYVVIASLSDPAALMRGEVWFAPVGLSSRAYEVVATYKGMAVAYANTIFYTVAGTLINLVLTAFAAYPLSHPRLRGKKFLSLVVLFPMWFSGGMIPFYLLFRDLNLLDTRISILLYAAVSSFYVVIMRSYFQEMPRELEESARMDGANDLTILVRILVPVATPVIASVGLYYAVGHWNSFFWQMILLSDESKLPVQVILQRIIIASQLGQDMERALTRGEASIPMSIKYAAIVITAIPIVLVYPLVQRYFVKGIMVGSVKG